jgi:amidase
MGRSSKDSLKYILVITYSVVPESHNQDTVGCLTRTVSDATYCLDGIYALDPRDNYTVVQRAPAGGFSQFLPKEGSLRRAIFGLP